MATGFENDPGVGQLDVGGVLRLDHFAAKNSDVKVLRFLLIPHGEEMRYEEASLCNRRVRQVHAAVSCEELEPKERIPKLPASNHTPAGAFEVLFDLVSNLTQCNRFHFLGQSRLS